MANIREVQNLEKNGYFKAVKGISFEIQVAPNTPSALDAGDSAGLPGVFLASSFLYFQVLSTAAPPAANANRWAFSSDNKRAILYNTKVILAQKSQVLPLLRTHA